MIELKNVVKTFKDGKNSKIVLNNINLKIENNDFITIMGASGCGKSTLLSVAALLSEPTSGNVLIDSKEINFKKSNIVDSIRRERIGLVFQNANLINCLNPLENILLAMNSDKKYSEKKLFALEMLDKVGIKDKYNSNVKSLSGGEAQRVSIIRALVNNPDVLFCDEPTGALDEVNSDKVINLLMEIQKEKKCAIVLVTHDKNIWNLGKKRILLEGGKMVGMDTCI